MYDWRDFDAVFKEQASAAYDQKTNQAISNSRRELDGVLFFDRICNSLGLKSAVKTYPPRNASELKKLFHAIIGASIPDLQKQALIYYLLKAGKGNADDVFARKVYLSDRYQTFVTGLWELDHCQFLRALDYLTHPALTQTYTDEIFTLLAQHPKCDNDLAIGYYISVSPPLRAVEAMDAYFTLLSDRSVPQAMAFARKLEQAKHKTYFEKLVYMIYSADAGPQRSEKALLLISIPFSDEEEQWFEECLLRGAASKLPHASDTVLMRRMALGKVTGTNSDLNRLTGDKIGGVNWEDIREIREKANVS